MEGETAKGIGAREKVNQVNGERLNWKRGFANGIGARQKVS